MKRPLLLTTVTLLVVTVAGSVGWLSRSRIPQVAQVVTDCEVAGPGANCGVMGDGVCAEMQTCNEWGGCGNGTFTTDWIACTPQMTDPGCPPDPGTCQNGTCMASWNASNGQACSMGGDRTGTCFEGSCNCAWDDCACNDTCPDPCSIDPDMEGCDPCGRSDAMQNPACNPCVDDECSEEEKCSGACRGEGEDCASLGTEMTEKIEAECSCKDVPDADTECKTDVGAYGCNDDETKCCFSCKLTQCTNGKDDDEDAAFYQSLPTPLAGSDKTEMGCLRPKDDDPLKLVYDPNDNDESDDVYNQGSMPDLSPEVLGAEPDATVVLRRMPSLLGRLVGIALAHHLDGIVPNPAGEKWDASYEERAARIAADKKIPIAVLKEIGAVFHGTNVWQGYERAKFPEALSPVRADPNNLNNIPNKETGDYGAVVVECHDECYKAAIAQYGYEKGNKFLTSQSKAISIVKEWCVTDCICGSRAKTIDAIQKDLDTLQKEEKDKVQKALTQLQRQLGALMPPGVGASNEARLEYQQLKEGLEKQIKAAEDAMKNIDTTAADLKKKNDEEKKKIQDDAVQGNSCYQECMTTGITGAPNACTSHEPDCCRAQCVAGVGGRCIPVRQKGNPFQGMGNRQGGGGAGGGGGGQQGGGGGGADGGGGEEETESGDEGGDTGGGSGSGGGGGGGNNGGTGGGSSQSSVVRLSSTVSSFSAISSRASTLSVRSASSVPSSLSSMRSSVVSVRSMSSLMSVGVSSVRPSSQPVMFFSSRASSLTVRFSQSSDITVIFLQSSDRPVSSVMQASSVPRFFTDSSLPPIYVQRSVSTDVLQEALRCGDGIRQRGEECDDGNGRDFDGCSADCLLERGACGDGIVQALLGEQCEPAVHDPSLSYACSARCRFVSSLCGNGVVDDGEQCDQGPANSTTQNSYCRPDCGLARCGDGIVDDASETCDDNNRLSGDGCSNVCKREQGAPTPLAGQLFEFPVVPQQQASVAWTPPLAQTWQALPPQTTTTGPASMAVMAAGAAGGVAWMRRKRKS